MEENRIRERLQIARERLGITKAEASRRLRLSRIAYNRYESGERVPSIQMLTLIAQCFHTSVSFLTGETDEMQPDYFVVQKKEEPSLFALVECCKKKDEASVNHLYRYAEIQFDMPSKK